MNRRHATPRPGWDGVWIAAPIIYNGRRKMHHSFPLLCFCCRCFLALGFFFPLSLFFLSFTLLRILFIHYSLQRKIYDFFLFRYFPFCFVFFFVSFCCFDLSPQIFLIQLILHFLSSSYFRYYFHFHFSPFLSLISIVCKRIIFLSLFTCCLFVQDVKKSLSEGLCQSLFSFVSCFSTNRVDLHTVQISFFGFHRMLCTRECTGKIMHYNLYEQNEIMYTCVY